MEILKFIHRPHFGQLKRENWIFFPPFFGEHYFASFRISIWEICIFQQFPRKKFNDKTLSSGYSLKRLLADKADTPIPGLTPILASPVRIFSKCFYWPLASPGPCWRPQPVHFSCPPLPVPALAPGALMIENQHSLFITTTNGKFAASRFYEKRTNERTNAFTFHSPRDFYSLLI